MNITLKELVKVLSEVNGEIAGYKADAYGKDVMLDKGDGTYEKVPRECGYIRCDISFTLHIFDKED